MNEKMTRRTKDYICASRSTQEDKTTTTAYEATACSSTYLTIATIKEQTYNEVKLFL